MAIFIGYEDVSSLKIFEAHSFESIFHWAYRTFL